MEYTCVEVRQGMMTLSEPTKSFRENAYQGNILHFENPLLDWSISNAVTKKIKMKTSCLIKKNQQTELTR